MEAGEIKLEGLGPRALLIQSYRLPGSFISSNPESAKPVSRNGVRVMLRFA